MSDLSRRKLLKTSAALPLVFAAGKVIASEPSPTPPTDFHSLVSLYNGIIPQGTFPEKTGTFSYNDSVSNITGLKCNSQTTQWIIYGGSNDTGAVLAYGTGSQDPFDGSITVSLASIKITN
jgi:hypothetical protein